MYVIDSDRYAVEGIETLIFPGGEPHAKVPLMDKSQHYLLYIKARSWMEFAYGCCVANAMAQQKLKLSVFMPYYPGARQDKTDGTAPLTTYLVSSLVKAALQGHDLYVFDIHSQTARAYSPARWNFMPSDMNLEPLIFQNIIGIIAPDKGAVERATEFGRLVLKSEMPVYFAEKTRSSHSGLLSGYKLPQLPDLDGDYLVVDDICDGGRTFNMLADAFDEQNSVSGLQLWVSHGIFSQGVHKISQLYKHIWTTDSWYHYGSAGRLTVIPLLHYIQPRIESFATSGKRRHD